MDPFFANPSMITSGDGWTEHVSKEGRKYYYNTLVSYSWLLPHMHPSQKRSMVGVQIEEAYDWGIRRPQFAEVSVCVRSRVWVQTQESQWGKPLSLQTPEEAHILLKTGWQEFSSADGKSYWFHSATKRSVWSTPKEVEEMLKVGFIERHRLDLEI